MRLARLLFALLAAACSSPALAVNPPSEESRLAGLTLAGLTFAPPSGPLPVVVTDSTGAEVSVTSAERIVPVNGDLAEVVYALGSG